MHSAGESRHFPELVHRPARLPVQPASHRQPRRQKELRRWQVLFTLLVSVGAWKRSAKKVYRSMPTAPQSLQITKTTAPERLQLPKSSSSKNTIAPKGLQVLLF